MEKIFIFFESFFMEIQNQQNKNLQQIQTQIDKVNAEMDSLKAVDEMLKKELDSLDMNP